MKVFIPFRDRGTDPRRAENLDLVRMWWHVQGLEPVVVDDGLEGDAQFNRHRAYNKAVEAFPETDIFIFSEADMLIPPEPIVRAAYLASQEPGLVVPFTQYRYLSDSTTATLRRMISEMEDSDIIDWFSVHWSKIGSVFALTPESTMDNGSSIGAVNVVSRETLERTGGFTEATRGNWYDDNIIEEGFKFLTGNPTVFVPGPAIHLYHLPGWTGDHLTQADRDATEHNKRILMSVRRLIRARDYSGVRRILQIRSQG